MARTTTADAIAALTATVTTLIEANAALMAEVATLKSRPERAVGKSLAEMRHEADPSIVCTAHGGACGAEHNGAFPSKSGRDFHSTHEWGLKGTPKVNGAFPTKA